MNLATHYGCANTYYLLPQSLDKYRNLQRRRTCFLRRSTATSLLPFPPFLSPSGPNLHVLGICLNHKIARVSFRVRSQRRRRLRLSRLLLSSPLLSSPLVVSPYFIPTFSHGMLRAVVVVGRRLFALQSLNIHPLSFTFVRYSLQVLVTHLAFFSIF